MSEDTKNCVVDVPTEQLKPGPWDLTPPLKFQKEPWYPTPEQWKWIKDKVVQCEECGNWHPLPSMSIDTLRQYISAQTNEVYGPPPRLFEGYTEKMWRDGQKQQMTARIPTRAPYSGWEDRPYRGKKPW